MFQYYRFSRIFTVVCLALAVWYGSWSIGTIAGIAHLVWIIVVLSVLEISLTFDNAVVNASVLKEMNQIWQKHFLLWGIAFAVFGMRIVFPLAIAARIGPIDADKEVHWIEVIERKLAAVSAVKAVEIGVLLLVLWGISSLLEPEEALTFLVAGILGIVTYIAVESISTALEVHDEKRRLVGSWCVRARAGSSISTCSMPRSVSTE